MLLREDCEFRTRQSCPSFDQPTTRLSKAFVSPYQFLFSRANGGDRPLFAFVCQITYLIKFHNYIPRGNCWPHWRRASYSGTCVISSPTVLPTSCVAYGSHMAFSLLFNLDGPLTHQHTVGHYPDADTLAWVRIYLVFLASGG